MGTKTSTTNITTAAAPAAGNDATAEASVDEYAGQGGSYVIENGRRRLVERTEPAGETPATNDEGN